MDEVRVNPYCDSWEPYPVTNFEAVQRNRQNSLDIKNICKSNKLDKEDTCIY